MGRVIKKAGWFVVAVAGAFAFAVIALKRGEPVSAIWVVIAASAFTQSLIVSTANS